MRRAVTVNVSAERADEVAKYLPRLPYLRTVLVYPRGGDDGVKTSDASLAATDAAVDRIKRELAGTNVVVQGIQFDFNIMPNGQERHYVIAIALADALYSASKDELNEVMVTAACLCGLIDPAEPKAASGSTAGFSGIVIIK